jgi:hypothetical protein
MRITACVLLLLAAGSLAAQEQSRWRRVHTYEDAFIEMEEIKLSFGNFGRVRFRTVFDESQELRGSPGVKYKSRVEDMELMCAERQYRVTELTYLGAGGKVLRTYKAGPDAEWRVAPHGGMMEKLLAPACRMIERKKL